MEFLNHPRSGEKEKEIFIGRLTLANVKEWTRLAKGEGALARQVWRDKGHGLR